MAVTRYGPMSGSPRTSAATSGIGMPTEKLANAAVRFSTCMNPLAQPRMVPTITARRPAGMFPGSCTPASQPMSRMPREIMPIQATSQTWNAGPMAMNVIATPARVPSIAARASPVAGWGR